MNATYVYGKYDSNNNLIVNDLFGSKSMVNISETEALAQFETFREAIVEAGMKGKATLFKLDHIKTIDI